MTPFRPKHVAVISLWAEDVSTAAHFYRDVVGLDFFPHHDHRPAFPARSSESPDFPLIAFAVEDLEGAIEHLDTHGVELPWGVETSEGARWVKFRDPGGNLIEFVQFREPIQH